MSSQNQTRRYKICFEFLGADFFGSQKQPNKRTAQGELEQAISTLTKNHTSIIPSGRTDTGVSVKYQTAHFDTCPINNLEKFLYQLNCILPSDIKVFELVKSDKSFHAQKNAKYKHYRYTIQNDHVASVFSNCSLFYPYFELNIDKINKILSYIEGEHDFGAFKSKSTNPYDDCIIYYAKAKREIIGRHEFVFIDIIGNRFLYNMIRTIVGELLYILRNNLNPEKMKEVLDSKDRNLAADVISPIGLCLEYVGYGDVKKYIEKFIKEGI